MSDSEDDIPVAQLLAKRKAAKTAPARKPKPKAAPKRKAAEREASSDDDDDVPLSQLRAKRAKAAAAKPSPKAKKAKASPARASSAPRSRAAVPAPPSGSRSRGAGDAMDEFYSLKKGELAQKLLCRWWYVHSWPGAESRRSPGAGYEELDGFPGVWICVEGDGIGAIVDRRDMSSCPNAANFCRLPAELLKTKLLAALAAQKEALTAREGDGATALAAKLDSDMRWASKVNPTTADKEAARWQRKWNIEGRYKYEADVAAFQ